MSPRNREEARKVVKQMPKEETAADEEVSKCECGAVDSYILAQQVITQTFMCTNCNRVHRTSTEDIAGKPPVKA